MLRGYSVALVVFLHLNLLCPFPNGVIARVLRTTEMSIGVDMFFVISGFVISRSLAPLWDVRTVADVAAMRDVPLSFYQKRFVRLWPTATTWMALSVVLCIPFRGHAGWPDTGRTFVKLVSGMVYLYNFQEAAANSALGYLWSLSVEWQFYLLFPLLLLFVRHDGLRLAVAFAALLLTVWFQPGGPVWWLFRFDGLPFGILLYVLLIRLGITLPEYRSLRRGICRHLLTGTLIVAAVLLPRFGFNPRFAFMLASGFCCVPVALAAANRGYITGLGIRPVISWLGSRSYSIYVAHIPAIMSVISIFEILRRSHPALWHLQVTAFRYVLLGYYVLSAATIAVASELTYRLVERPSHRASQRIPLFGKGAGAVAGQPAHRIMHLGIREAAGPANHPGLAGGSDG